VPQIIGKLDWNCETDGDGHRDYKIVWLIEGTALDGPANIGLTPGLPLVGAMWAFGDDIDLWAFCKPNKRAEPVVVGEPNTLWTVEQLFSSRPLRRCQDESIEDPLAEPPTIGGTFSKFMKEAVKDKDGKIIRTSSWERFPKDFTEIDDPRPTVVIGINVATLNLAFYTSMLKGTPLNNSPMWGVGARCVKFSNFNHERKLYGTCAFYYSIEMEFEINFDTWDVKAPDQGTRKLKPDGNPNNPADFEEIVDEGGYAVREPMLLNGSGEVLADGLSPVEKTLRPLKDSNLMLLGVPASLA
jgi:hypothetical protein